MIGVEESIRKQVLEEMIEHIKEYVKLLEGEPAEDLIKLKDVYHNLRRILGDE